MTESLYGTETPGLVNEADGISYALGERFTVSVAGNATFGKWYFPTTTPSATVGVEIYIIRVSDNVVMCSAIFAAGLANGWQTVAFSPAGALSVGVTYSIAYITPLRYVATVGYAFPKNSGNGNVNAVSPNGYFTTSPASKVVPGTLTNNNYFADFIFEPSASTTPVSAALDLQWNVSNSVSKAVDLRWNVSNSVPKSLDLRWAVNSTISKALDLRWAVSNSISKAVDLRWAVNSQVSASLDLRWGVGGTVSSALDLRWAVLSSLTPVSAPLDLRWAVRAAVTSSLDARWAVRALASAGLDARWAVLGPVSATLDARWAVRGSVSASVDLRWAVLALAARGLDLRWTVREQVSASLNLRWVVESDIPEVRKPTNIRAVLTEHIESRPEQLGIPAYLSMQ